MVRLAAIAPQAKLGAAATARARLNRRGGVRSRVVGLPHVPRQVTARRERATEGAGGQQQPKMARWTPRWLIMLENILVQP